MSNPFQKATRSQVFLKLAITGVTGSGKTYSALRLAKGLLDGTDKRIAFLDTENDSASLYSDKFDFDVIAISPPFLADDFANGVDAAIRNGYGAIIIDSASHLWKGILAYKSQIDERGGNSFTNWKEPDKKFQAAIDTVLQSKIHAIFCMRSKMEFIVETNGQGKQAPRKVGLAPIMREGIEYEFTTVFDVAMNHEAASSKDRSEMFPVDKFFMITEETGKQFANWLKTATPKPDPQPIPPTAPLTDEEALAKNIERYRTEIASKAKKINESSETYEEQFCLDASALHEDNRARHRLEDFTLSDLRAMFDKRGTIYKMVTDRLNATAKA